MVGFFIGWVITSMWNKSWDENSGKNSKPYSERIISGDTVIVLVGGAEGWFEGRRVGNAAGDVSNLK